MTDFDSLGDADIVIKDLFGLRTFKAVDGKLSSVVVGTGYWEDGMCDAICVSHKDDLDHVAPAEGCHCGIYAAYTLRLLVTQYKEEAEKIIAVVKATGTTITGDDGFKTRQAEVVAYWAADNTAEEKACDAHCPDARRWFDRDLMIAIFELDERSTK